MNDHSEKAIKDEVERKNAEIARQQHLADERDDPDDPLGKQDKTDADSFPASDPPAQP